MMAPSAPHLARALADLLDEVPLLQVLGKLGLRARPSGLGGHLLDFCPVASCRKRPYGVAFEGEASRPRVAIIGDGWTCWACGAGGRSAAFVGALLEGEVAQERFRAACLGNFRRHPDPVVALRKSRAWAARHVPELELDLVEVIADQAALAVSREVAGHG